MTFDEEGCVMRNIYTGVLMVAIAMASDASRRGLIPPLPFKPTGSSTST